MAKKRPENPEEIAAEAEFDAAELEDAIAELPGEGSKVSLWRMPAEGKPGRPAFIDDISPENFSLGFVKGNHGKGRYRLVAISKNRKTRIERILEIDGPPDTPAPAVAAPSEDPRVRQLELQVELLKLQAAHGNGNQNGLDYAKLLEIQNTGFQQALKVLELMQPTRSQTSDVDKIIGGVQKMLEIGTGMGGGGEGGSDAGNILYWIDKLAPTIKDVLSVAHQPPAGDPRMLIANYNPAWPGPRPPDPPPPGATHQQNVDTAPADPLLEKIKPHLDFLIANAAAGRDPQPWAAIIVDNATPAELAELKRRLEGDFLGELSRLDPRVSAQAAWWQELAKEILEEMEAVKGTAAGA